MAKKNPELIKKAERLAKEILSTQLSPDIKYHNLQHTRDVVQAAREIAEKTRISEEDMEILELAAWFHDLGYREQATNHEDASATIALEFLSKEKYDDMKAARVVGCIMATKMPQSPKNELEAILCDADLLHLAGENYFSKADLLHEEMQQVKGQSIPEKNWLEGNKDFIKNHEFFTEYARQQFAEKQQQNLKKVKKKLKKMEKKGKFIIQWEPMLVLVEIV